MKCKNVHNKAKYIRWDVLETKDYRKREIEKDRKRYDLIAISVTKPVVFVQTKFSPQYPTARGILGK